MDRLQVNQQLNVNDQLVSNNGLVKLVMQGDGNLVLYRTVDGRALWASNTWQKPVNHTIMQGDGNLVAYSPNGQPFWASGTVGHPGASVVLQDDGNLVVYDNRSRPLWASKTGLFSPILEPCIEYADAAGYRYVETNDSFKKFCSALPCFGALQWPGYATKFFPATINNQPVIIQLWKGWCQKFAGQEKFPGGLGAEVGVYHKIPGRARPTSFPFLPPAVAALMASGLQLAGDDNIWWPFPELNTEIEFDLINPITNKAFFHAGPEKSYWMNKWMNESSYGKYQAAQGRRWPWLPAWVPGNSLTPIIPTDYRLSYKINGQPYPVW